MLFKEKMVGEYWVEKREGRVNIRGRKEQRFKVGFSI